MDKAGSHFQIDIDLKKFVFWVVLFCFGAEAVILILDILMNLVELWYFEKFKKLSDVALEKSFGTWFSVVQNLVVGLTAFFISAYYRWVSGRSGRFWGWLVVALFFAYISLDDHLVLHERISGTFGQGIFNWVFGKDMPLPTYEWIFLLGPFFGAFGLFFLIFLYGQLNSRRERGILIEALALWSIAVLLDAWEGTSQAYSWTVQMTGFKALHVRHFFMLIEEMLEMVGSTLFLYLFLSYLKRLFTKRRTCMVFSE